MSDPRLAWLVALAVILVLIVVILIVGYYLMRGVVSGSLALVGPLENRIQQLERENRRHNTQILRLQNEIARLEVEIERLTWENSELKSGVTILVHQVEQLGAQPRYRPPKDEFDQ